jgi:hypothetical protein
VGGAAEGGRHGAELDELGTSAHNAEHLQGDHPV